MIGSIAIVTGSLGLVGSEAVRVFAEMGLDVVGVDNDTRAALFGEAASTSAVRHELERCFRRYRHLNADIRDEDKIEKLFLQYGQDVAVVVHAAAQPSHDWASSAPKVDFQINATATLNLLEAMREHAPGALFIFMSSNKVYGSWPNRLPLVESETRFTLPDSHRYSAFGVDESMSIDQTEHSLFGVSKTAADLMVQEYASRFDLWTVVFRAGCITGAGHRATEAHGFLAYLCRTVTNRELYTVIGFGGKQVRDNLHANDLAAAFGHVLRGDRISGVYNIGGGIASNCSVLEALLMCGQRLKFEPLVVHEPKPRYGDHMWWIGDTRKFANAYPAWKPKYRLPEILDELIGLGSSNLAIE